MKIQRRVPRALVDTLLKEGALFRSPLFSFRYRLGGVATVYSATVAKKTVKLAVDRNYNRRICKEVVYRVLSQNKIKPFVGIFFIQKDLRGVSSEVLVSEVSMALKRTSIL